MNTVLSARLLLGVMSSGKHVDGGMRIKAGGSQQTWPRRETNQSTPALRPPNDVCQLNSAEDGQTVNPDNAGC
ncbi:hypothetical protein T08_727 [Trichinella sp. T8]|nr:hypothetical protein T08_727 [Trichinella sp. T8]